jgi:hypothetical protein
MKLYIRLLSVVLLLGLVLFGCTGPDKKGHEQLKAITVDSLKVADIPYDGGDGLMLSWTPLPKEKRVQEYRIYRGVNPDTLFFLGSIPVNVKTGVAADRMYYSDSGYNTFIDLVAPHKLKNEKQNKGSIIYRAIPWDAEIAARLSEHYDLYSQVDDKDYYYHTQKARSADKTDETVYAGMKFNQQTILSSLKAPAGADTTWYYYTVVPVNERNQFMGIAKPVKAYPLDDRPEKSPALHCVALQDARKLQFEWDYPLLNDDLAAYMIYMLPAGLEANWDTMPEVQQQMALAAGGIPVAQGMIGGGALKNYCTLTEQDLAQIAPGVTWDKLLASRFTIMFQDNGMNPSPLSSLSAPAFKTSQDLPMIPRYRVEDKPMDKGDRLSLTWEEPIVYLTKTTTLGKKGTTLKINYAINKTDAQKIANVFFDFYIPGKKTPFVKINEFHQDNIIKIAIPQKYSLRDRKTIPSDSLMVKITIAVHPYKLNSGSGRLSYGKTTLLKNYELIQYIKPDPAMMAYMPTRHLLRNGVDVFGIQNVVFRKSFRSDNFTLIKRTTSFDNSLDVTVPYVTTYGQGVQGFNFVRNDTLFTYMGGQRFSRPLNPGEKSENLTLLSSEIDFVFDKENKGTLRTSIFTSEAKNTINQLSDKMSKKQKEYVSKNNRLSKAAPDSALVLKAEIDKLDSEITGLKKKIKQYQDNVAFGKSLKYRTNRGRMHYVSSVREPELRTFSYQLTRTDGKGLFVESQPDTTKAGEFNYYTPISNWFDWGKLMTLLAVLIFGAAVVIFVNLAKRGKDLYMRPIAGLSEIDNAIGRATEMGRPMLYCMGIGGISDIATLASMGILGLVAKKAAEYDTKLIVPCYDYLVMPIAQEIVREAHYAVGRPDSFDKNNVFYLTSTQFAYVAGVNGIMIRERMATNFFMGYFAAEALLMTETGSAIGAVQIAGSDAITQIPFFITTCDYTLIGEELYAASAYLNREPMLLGTLKAQDYFKFLILVFVIVGAVLASFQLTGLMQLFPLK